MSNSRTLSSRITQLAPSPTLALDATIKSMQAAGTAVLNLGVGEPDFDTPQAIKDAAKQAIDAGHTHYTATAGIKELRQAIAHKLKQDNNIEYTVEEIVVGVGSKQLLFHAFQVLCQKGDEVLVPVPTWSTYVEQIKLSGASAVMVPLSPPFKLTAADLRPFITPLTKCLIINTPSNPTGAVIDAHELAKIGQLAIKHNFWIIADEIYEKIMYEGNHLSIASINQSVKEHTITINGFSKAYAMTGWRVGYAAGPKPVIQAMADLQSQITSNTCSIAQYAALAALQLPDNEVRSMVKQFKHRRDVIFEQLATIPQLAISQPEGAFYCFVSLQAVLNNQFPTSQAWCEALLQEQQVGVVPGEAFLYPGYFRLSYAASLTDLQKAVTRIKAFITNHL